MDSSLEPADGFSERARARSPAALEAEVERLRAALLDCARMARQIEDLADRAAVRLAASELRRAAMRRQLENALNYIETFPAFRESSFERQLVEEMRQALVED